MELENKPVETLPVEQVEQKEEKTYTPVELEAIDQGWIPKEEFDGDEAKFIDAPEFLRRGELFSKIEKQSKELKAVRKALEAFSQHHSKVKEMEYERALKALKAERRQATIDGDAERALILEDKIEEIRDEKERIVRDGQVQIEEPETYTAEFTSWVSRNPWYETNRTMRATADALGKQLYNEGHSPAEVLEMVEEEMKKEFAHKFERAPVRRTAVEASTRGTPKKDDFVMTADEKRMMREIVAVTPGFTEADYIRDLKALRGKE
jgi:hypothetical protein